MVLHFTEKLLETSDPNGGKYGDWILRNDNFNVTCRFCKSNVCLKEGEKALSKHSATGKHQKAKTTAGCRGSIVHAFAAAAAKNAEARGTEELARDAEIIYLHHLEAHGISPHAAACTSTLFAQMFPDSKIAAKFSFSDSKQGYEVTHGLGPYYSSNLTSRLQSEYFSINIDESTVLKSSQLAITCRYFNREKDKIVTEHFQTVNIMKKDAESIVALLDKTFTDRNIDFRKHMIHVETDSCPAMRGVRNGVIKKLKESMEYISDLGGCPDHHIANSLKYAMLSFDQELKTLFVDVYQDIEKYPTHQERYQQACKHVGVQVKPMFRMVDTRYVCVLHISRFNCFYYRTS